MDYLNIGVVNFFIVKATHHAHTFNIRWDKEQIRFLLLPRPLLRLQKKLVYFHLKI